MKRLLALAGLALLLPAHTQLSGASFVAVSSGPASTWSTAADFNTVSVALTDPGTPLEGAVPLAVTAASDRGIASVVLESSPAGAGTWTAICTDTTAPYGCDWTAPDGLYDLRAVATDAAGYSRTAVQAARRRDGTAPTVSLADPGAAVHGTVSLAATAADAGTGIDRIRIQARPQGGAWTDVCTVASTTASCPWATAALTDGFHELRATAWDELEHATTTAVRTVRVDNAPPSSTMTDPPDEVRGTFTLTSTPSDPGGSVARVVYQGRQAGTTTWYDVCTVTAAPWSCSVNSAIAPDGAYEMRAVTVDAAGNQTASAAYGGRIDNTIPAAAFTNPGSPITGTVTLRATASDATSGVQHVRFQRAADGSATWTTLCTDTTAPYSCDWEVPAADQLHDLRIVARDLAGNERTVVVQDRLGGTRPAAADVQAANGGIAGLPDAGDTLTLSFTEAVAPASVLAGWAGAATAVTVRIADAGASDALTVWNAAGDAQLPLGTVALGRDVTATTAALAGTMTLAGAQVALALGAQGGGDLVAAPGPGTLTWTPGTAVRDVAGLGAVATPATETGAEDEDL